MPRSALAIALLVAAAAAGAEVAPRATLHLRVTEAGGLPDGAIRYDEASRTMIAELLALAVAAAGPPRPAPEAEPPAPPAADRRGAPAPERRPGAKREGETSADEPVLENLELLQQLELLDAMELLEDGKDEKPQGDAR